MTKTSNKQVSETAPGLIEAQLQAQLGIFPTGIADCKNSVDM